MSSSSVLFLGNGMVAPFAASRFHLAPTPGMSPSCTGYGTDVSLNGRRYDVTLPSCSSGGLSRPAGVGIGPGSHPAPPRATTALSETDLPGGLFLLDATDSAGSVTRKVQRGEQPLNGL